MALLPRLPGRHRPRRGRDLVHHRERATRHPDPVEEPRGDRRGRPRALRRELARGPAGRRRGARHLADRAREAQGRGRRRGRARQAPEPGDGRLRLREHLGLRCPGAARRALERRPRARDGDRRSRRRRPGSQGPHRPDRRGARPTNPEHLGARLRRGRGPPPRRHHPHHGARGRALPAPLRGGRLDANG